MIQLLCWMNDVCNGYLAARSLQFFTTSTTSPPRTRVDQLIGFLNSWRLLWWHGQEITEWWVRWAGCFFCGGKTPSSTENGGGTSSISECQVSVIVGLLISQVQTGEVWIVWNEWVPSWHEKYCWQCRSVNFLDSRLQILEVTLRSTGHPSETLVSQAHCSIHLPTGTDDLRTFGSCCGDYFWRGFLRGILLSDHEAWQEGFTNAALVNGQTPIPLGWLGMRLTRHHLQYIKRSILFDGIFTTSKCCKVLPSIRFRLKGIVFQGWDLTGFTSWQLGSSHWVSRLGGNDLVRYTAVFAKMLF